MKATKGQAITTGVFSVLKIITGIIVCVLFKIVFDVYEKMSEHQGVLNISEPPLTQWWWLAAPYVVPGLVGLGAAISRNQVAYGFYMAGCIISCIVAGVFFFLGLAFLMAMARTGGLDCQTIGSTCVCKSGLDGSSTPIEINDCADLNKMVHLSYGVSAMLVLGWIFCLAGSIISCASCCCGEHPQPQVVMMSSYPGQITVSTGTQFVAGSQLPAGNQYAAGPPPQYEAATPAMEEADDKNQYKYNRMY